MCMYCTYMYTLHSVLVCTCYMDGLMNEMVRRVRICACTCVCTYIVYNIQCTCTYMYTYMYMEDNWMNEWWMNNNNRIPDLWTVTIRVSVS